MLPHAEREAYDNHLLPSSRPESHVPRLIVIKGTDEGKQFELGEGVMAVGRDAGNPIRLHDTEVSRRHAEFHKVEGGVRLIDKSSANGTFVNGQLTTDALLQPGDQIQIGQSVLIYSAGRSEASGEGDLADRISMITRQDVELSSAIIKTIAEAEGSRILAQPESVEGPWLKNALANLSVMYQTIQAVSHILDVNELLEKIMELIFQSIDADRGCIMLRNADTGQFEPKAIRRRSGLDPQEKIALSRTIMDHVLREKLGVLVSDASRDERFSAGQSIVRLGIREVICVPMKGRHETLGVLYLDTHSTHRDLVEQSKPAGKFTEDHLALAIAIGHQAALAVEETRYHHALVQSERLAAIGQTIAALSHHIKNILQGLRSGSDILKMGLTEKNDELVQKGWRIVEKNQGKIFDLVMDMLSYSKDREPAFEQTDLNRVVRDVVELIEGRATENSVKIDMRLDPNLPRTPADPEGIHRALLNIAGNALDAVEGRKNSQIAFLTALEDGGEWVRIAVVDNGAGIGAEKQAELFKPFVSTKGARGTGLGLAVSRKILREHGGDVLLQSQPGKGSKFILRLPLYDSLSAELGANTENPVAPA
jgi:signal transduction histidine kinase/pSer/pThr/pTyr-binding forkhead associated (FHA) protein